MPEAKEDFRKIGSKIRRLRRMKKMRLIDLAKEANCSESLLSKIEHGRSSPSLKILHRIAQALDSSIANLFEVPREDEVLINAEGERPVIALKKNGEKPGITLERLTLGAADDRIDGNIHVVPPGVSSGGEITHEGQEIGYVLTGELELVVSDRHYRLLPGTSFHFSSLLPHSYSNPGKEVTRVLWVDSPPTF